MHKFIISSILILSMLLLSSCSMVGSRIKMLNQNSDEKIAEAKSVNLVEAIKNQDKVALRAIFSKQAAKDADDFDSGVDQLFQFMQGKIESREKLDGLAVLESDNYGHTKKGVSSYYYVTTDKEKYFFLLDDYPVDTDHPDNVGLYMLLVVKAEDEKNIYDKDKKILFDGDKNLKHAGVYIPIK